MRSVVHYSVPAARVDDVRALSESVGYDSLRKELSASCHFLGANVATLFLCMQVAEGKTSLVEARRQYGPSIKATLGADGAVWYRFFCASVGVDPINDGALKALNE